MRCTCVSAGYYFNERVYQKHYTTTIVSEISSSRVYTKLYVTTDFSIVIRSPLHPLKYSDHIIGDKYVELNYVVGKNVSELIDHILEFILDSIYEQIDKCDDSDIVILDYLSEALKDTVEINCTAYYLLTRTPQFFDAIGLYQLYKATRYLTNAPMKPKKASTKSIDRNRNLPKIYGSDKPIRSFIRKYCDLYHLKFGYYEVLDNVFYDL